MKKIVLDTRKIRKELKTRGWDVFQIQADVSCASWSQKHFRVTSWRNEGDRTMDEKLWAMGDGKTLQSAWNALLYHVKKGNFGFDGGKKPH